MTGLFLLAMPLLVLDTRRLPFKVYIPYSIAPLLPYVLTYLQQVAVLIYGVSLNVSFDCLVYGFIIHTCGQIELLCYRITETFEYIRENEIEEKKIDAVENLSIAEYVNHHILVYNIMYKIQSLFVWTITVLFFFSLITLCTSIYQMSKVSTRYSLSLDVLFTIRLHFSFLEWNKYTYCLMQNTTILVRR